MGESRGGKERRVHERAAFPGAASVTTAGGVIACSIVDISRGGMALRSPQAAQPGEFVRLQLSVPNSKGARAWIDPDAVVVRTQPGPHGVVWGVTFASPDPNRDALITSLVNAARTVAPEDVLRSGTRSERNLAITQLLTKTPAPPSAPQPTQTTGPTTTRRTPTGETATAQRPTGETVTARRPTGETTTARKPTGETVAARKPTGETTTAPGTTGAIRRRPGTAETPVQKAPARKPSTRETPIPQSRASRELRELYRAALAEVDRDVKGKPKRKP